MAAMAIAQSEGMQNFTSGLQSIALNQFENTKVDPDILRKAYQRTVKIASKDRKNTNTWIRN